MISGGESVRSWSSDAASSAVFGKTKERFGGLSNMAAGFPLAVNGLHFRTAEALYQALRFPGRADVQRNIIDQPSPMGAKLVSRENDESTRADWREVRVQVMRWCLEVKLYQHEHRFGELLRETGDRAIVEYSRRDDFWGAVRGTANELQGRNILGLLLMELRDRHAMADGAGDLAVSALSIPNFVLLGEPISSVEKAALSPPNGQTELFPLD